VAELLPQHLEAGENSVVRLATLKNMVTRFFKQADIQVHYLEYQAGDSMNEPFVHGEYGYREMFTGRDSRKTASTIIVNIYFNEKDFGRIDKISQDWGEFVRLYKPVLNEYSLTSLKDGTQRIQITSEWD
jgi:hypothetical protein